MERPFQITPALLRQARDRSHLSYLTMCDKLKCRAGHINDILCGNTTSGPFYMQFLNLMDPFWPPKKEEKAKPTLKKEDKKNEDENEEGEEEVIVKDDHGADVQIPKSVKFIPRSQGGGLDPNRPKTPKEKRNYLDYSVEGLAKSAQVKRDKEDLKVGLKELDAALDLEADPGDDLSDREPTKKELRELEGKKPVGRPKSAPIDSPKAQPVKAYERAPAKPRWGMHGQTIESLSRAWECHPSSISLAKQGKLKRSRILALFNHFVATGELSPPEKKGITDPIPDIPDNKDIPDVPDIPGNLECPILQKDSISKEPIITSRSEGEPSDASMALIWADAKHAAFAAETLTVLGLKLKAVIELREAYEFGLREYENAKEVAKQLGIDLPYKV